MIKEKLQLLRQKDQTIITTPSNYKKKTIFSEKKPNFSESADVQNLKQKYEQRGGSSLRKKSQQNFKKQYSYRYSPNLQGKNTINAISERRSHKIGQILQNDILKLPSITKRSKEHDNLRLKEVGKHNKKKFSYDFNSIQGSQSKQKQISNSKKSPRKQYPLSIRTRAGCNGRIMKVNQDLDIVSQKLPHGIKLFCVCDGHGTNGHHVVAFIRKKLLENLKKSLDNLKDLEFIQQQIYMVMIKTNNQLLQSQINTQLSGSTVVAVFIYEQRLICYNVGDSRAILINHQYGVWKTVQVSNDHKPQRKDEAKRILAAGGRIQTQVNQKNQSVGPLRVWMKDIKSPGLAMTRSFGDKAGIKAGTTGEPQVTQYTIMPENKYLFIASDGVWQHLQNYQIVKIISKQLQQEQLQDAADNLLNFVAQIWDQNYSSRDDITFLLVKLNPFSTPNTKQ